MEELPCGIGIEVELQRRRCILKPGVLIVHQAKCIPLLKFPKMLCVVRWQLFRRSPFGTTLDEALLDDPAWSRRKAEKVHSEVVDATCNVKYNFNSLWSILMTGYIFVERLKIYYFVKCDPDETICEKITRLNILPNQFYAAPDEPPFPLAGGRGGGAAPYFPCTAASEVIRISVPF